MGLLIIYLFLVSVRSFVDCVKSLFCATGCTCEQYEKHSVFSVGLAVLVDQSCGYFKKLLLFLHVIMFLVNCFSFVILYLIDTLLTQIRFGVLNMRLNNQIKKDIQYWKFSFYGFLKNLQFFDPFMILFFKEMGMSFFEIGLLYSVREIVTNVTEIPTGVIADSFGRRSAMVLAFLSYIASFLIFYFFPVFSFYIAAMVFFALGESFRSGTHKAMIMEYLKQNGMTDQKVVYYGHTRSWAQMGSAFSALIAAGLVFFTGSFRTVFLWSIVPYIGGLLLIVSYPKNLDFSCEQESCSEEESGGWKNAFRTLQEFTVLFKERNIRRAFVNSTLFDALFKSVKDYVQPVLKGFALSLPLFAAFKGNQGVALVSGVVYFILYLMTSYSSKHASAFHARFKQMETGINASFVCGIFVILSIALSLIHGLTAIAILFFISLYILVNVRRPATLAYISNNIKGSVLATGLSGESQMKTLFVAVVSPLFGLGVDKLGLGYALLFLALLPVLFYPAAHLKKLVK